MDYTFIPSIKDRDLPHVHFVQISSVVANWFTFRRIGNGEKRAKDWREFTSMNECCICSIHDMALIMEATAVGDFMKA